MNPQQKGQKKIRNSSIELLKIIGIFLVVTSHVIQSLRLPNEFIGSQDYVVNLHQATTNVQQLILSMLQTSGAFGNMIFFICSAWFLLESDRVDKKKILQLLLDIWVVSVIILTVVFFLRKGNIDIRTIITQLLPTTYANN
ncbi:MAG: acyltransferase family protein [Clostridia bacterium]|nr:acyltransferase family protein [Clostridia bacterium]